MARKFPRVALLSIAKESETQFGVFEREIEIRELQIKFSVQKTKQKHPNSCRLSVFNLSDDSRALFQQKPARVSISAGYDDAPQLLFTGNLTWAETSRVGPDLETEVLIADGARPMKYARVSRSFAPGVDAVTVILYAIKAMNFTAPENLATDSALRARFQSGETLHGNAASELTRLLEPFGYEWSVQNGRLQALRDNETIPSTTTLGETILGDPKFGPPVQTEKGRKKPVLSLSVALNPELQVGQRVKVDASRIKGMFKILTVTHSGDTHGQDWSTTIEGSAS